MSAGMRDQRAWILTPTAAGSGGWGGVSGYTRALNPASVDGAWWCRKEPISSRDSQVAEQLDARAEVEFAFSDEVLAAEESPGKKALRADSAIEHAGEIYRVAGPPRHARALREVIVMATLATDVTTVTP